MFRDFVSTTWTGWDIPDQVLDVLKNLPCPPPIQHVAAEPDEEEPVKKEIGEVPAKPGKKKKGTPAPVKADTSKTSSSKPKMKSGESGGVYKAGDFQETYKNFVQDKRDSGVSFKDALASWKSSAERAELLKHMSHSEKKRRRFI